MRFFKSLALVCTVIFIIAGILYYSLRSPEIRKQRVRFNGLRGQRLVGDVYLPERPDGKLPGVLLCHGVEANKEVMGHLGVEFARRGFVAMAFDYGGYGESARHGDELSLMVEDTLAALKFLYLRPETNGERSTALVGHSMGVTYAVELAGQVPGIAGVVGLGNEAVTASVPPRNVALAMGIYDAFHTLPDMLGAVRESSGNPNQSPNQTIGDFSKGTARSLITSPYSDHGIEPVDPLLMQKTIEWVKNSIPGASIPQLGLREPWRAQARIVMFVSAILALTALLALIIMPRSSESDGTANMSPIRSRAHFIVVLVAATIGNLSSPDIAIWCTDISLAALIAGSIACALVRQNVISENREIAFIKMRKGLMRGAGFIALIAICLLVGLLVGGIKSAWSLGYISKIPAFLYYILILRPYEGLCMLRAYGFHRYSEAWIPGITLSTIIFMELARPGIVSEIASYAARTLVKALQLKGPFKLQTSRAGLAGAVTVFALLGYVLFKRFREGWLSGEAVHRMMIISLKFMILPLALFILVVNLWGNDER